MIDRDATHSTMTQPAGANRSAPVLPSVTKIGEELPVFCERCGYSLHGLAQLRCEHCTLLQFHCPECGHHQPINTLRPAAQLILGRIRAGWLILVVFFKCNLFGWLLFAWAGMGAAWSYRYDWQTMQQIQATQVAMGQSPAGTAVWMPVQLDWESVISFTLFAFPTGALLRLALIRWRRGWAVGLVLAALVLAAIALGVAIRGIDFVGRVDRINPYNSNFVTLIALACGSIILGATIAWPIWVLLVTAFLPKNTAVALLNWQRSLSSRGVSALSRPDGSVVPH